MADSDPLDAAELSILEYARFHGLAVDHQAQDPLTAIDPRTVHIDLKDPPGSVILPSATDLCTHLERLTVDRSAIELLSLVCRKPPWTPIPRILLPNPFRAHELKVELPLLQTDEELDLDEFTHRKSIDLENENLPLEIIDEEQDENLARLSTAEDILSESWTRVSSEKLEFTKDDIVYLQSVIKPQKDDTNLITPSFITPSFSKYSWDASSEITSPLLLPVSPSLEALDLSVDAEKLSLPDNNNSPSQTKLEELGKERPDANPIQCQSTPATSCLKLENFEPREVDSVIDVHCRQKLEEPEELILQSKPAQSELSFSCNRTTAALNTLTEEQKHNQNEDFSEKPHLAMLIKKRKRDLTQDGRAITDSSGESQPDKIRRAMVSSCSGAKPLELESFSTFGALEGFISTRTGHVMVKNSLKGRSLASSAPSQTNIPFDADTMAVSGAITSPATQVHRRLPSLPETYGPLIPRQFIISSTLMSFRKVVRLIREYLPQSEFIERDFSAHAQARALVPSLAPTSPDLSWDGIKEEADLLVNSSTGIIVTNILRLRQKSNYLQAGIASNAIYNRVTMTAPRYNKLIIVVSQNTPPEAPPMPLTKSDKDALIELDNFVQNDLFITQDVEVSVEYSAGGDQELAVSLVNLMVKHAAKEREIEQQRLPETYQKLLVHEELSCELWLRSMEMNAYAAQTICSVIDLRRTSPEMWAERFLSWTEDDAKALSLAEILGSAEFLMRVAFKVGRLLD